MSIDTTWPVGEWTAADSEALDAEIETYAGNRPPLNRDPHLYQLLSELRDQSEPEICEGICGRPLVPDTHPGPAPDGYARHRSGGRCQPCYQRHLAGISTPINPRTFRSAATRQAALDLIGKGWKTHQVAAHLGVSDRTVVRWLAKHRQETGDTMPRNTKKLTPRQVRDIRAAYASGFTTTQIGRKYGIARTTAYKIVHLQSWKDVS